MQSMGFELRYAGRNAPIKLAMQRLWLTGQILPIGARLFARHDFRHDEDQNLEVVYSFMLPRDAALRKFTIVGEGFEAHSELRPVEEAVAQYEAGLESGDLATLARGYQDGVINLSLGNLRKGQDVSVTLEILAGVELSDNGLRFRFPFTLAPGYHSEARMIETERGGEIELPTREFGDVLLPPYRRGADGLHDIGFDLGLRLSGEIAEIASPSHSVRMRKDNGAWRVSLASAADVPNRDLVLDVRLERPAPQIIAGDKRFALVVPSTVFGESDEAPRKIAFVVDRSGSMSGAPMTQAKRAVEACLAALAPEDQFAVIAFDNVVETFKDKLAPPTAQWRAQAAKFFGRVEARGGTEMALGFSAGARLVGDGGFVLLVTDGQVMGTVEILARARALNVRIFCLGIGSASQDRFLALLSSATGGVSRFVTPKERVDLAAVDLFASIAPPRAAGVELSGAAFAVLPPTTVHGGVPWTALAERPASGKIVVSWRGGTMGYDIPAPDPEVAEAVWLLEGARRITELESRMTSDADKALQSQLNALSSEYGLASRACALVAVVKQEGEHDGAPPLTRVVPVGMPDGTSFESYFGRLAAPAPLMMRRRGLPRIIGEFFEPSRSAPSSKKSRVRGDRDDIVMETSMMAGAAPTPASDLDGAPMDSGDTDALLAIASSLEADGGVPGRNGDERALKTIDALILFGSEGHTQARGVFRAHVKRMVSFLESIETPPDRRSVIDEVIACLSSESKMTTLAAARSAKAERLGWGELERAVRG